MSSTSGRKSRPKVLLVNRALVLNKQNEVLVVQRSKDDTYMPSKWEFPGGKLDVGQDITHALEREVLEETGLVITFLDKIAFCHHETIMSGKYKNLPYILLVGIAKALSDTVSLSNEHDNYAWVNRDKVLEYDLMPECRSAFIVLNTKIAY